MFSAATIVARCTSPGKATTWVRCAAWRSVYSRFSTCSRPLQQQAQRRENSALTESKSSGGSEISTATAFETVKETTKTAGNAGVILLGLGITGSILYVVFREFFSKNSPNNIYSKALDDCKRDQSLRDHLGEPIKGYGEANSRGRRRHVSHGFYLSEGSKHMFLQFYIQGSRKKGTVYVDMKENDNGDLERQLLVVELEDLLQTRIVLEDNRLNSLNTIENLPALH